MSNRWRGAKRPPTTPNKPPPVTIEPEAILAENGLLRFMLTRCGVPARDGDDVLQECLSGVVVPCGRGGTGLSRGWNRGASSSAGWSGSPSTRPTRGTPAARHHASPNSTSRHDDPARLVAANPICGLRPVVGPSISLIWCVPVMNWTVVLEQSEQYLVDLTVKPAQLGLDSLPAVIGPQLVSPWSTRMK